MSDFTPRANLRLPGGGSTGTILPDEQVDIDVLNDNFRKIDALLGARNVPSASSYSGSIDGDLIYARDTKLLSVYDANSAGLVHPRVAGGTRFKGTQAQMNAFTGAEDGDSFFNTTDNTEYLRLGGAWAARPGPWLKVLPAGTTPLLPGRLRFNPGWSGVTSSYWDGVWHRSTPSGLQIQGAVAKSSAAAALEEPIETSSLMASPVSSYISATFGTAAGYVVVTPAGKFHISASLGSSVQLTFGGFTGAP